MTARPIASRSANSLGSERAFGAWVGPLTPHAQPRNALAVERSDAHPLDGRAR